MYRGPRCAVLGDPPPDQLVSALPPGRLLVLGAPGASLAEVIAGQLPRLADAAVADVLVQLGWRDVLDGFDESYCHARLVECFDLLAGRYRPASVRIAAIPPAEVAPAVAAVRVQCNAAAEVTADLRGLRWCPDLAAVLDSLT